MYSALPVSRTAGQLGEVAALDVVVGFEEDLTQARLADRVVLEVELIEPVERVDMGLKRICAVFARHRKHSMRQRQHLLPSLTRSLALPLCVTYVHVQRVDAEVVRGQLERLKHLLQRQVAAVTVDDDVLQQQQQPPRGARSVSTDYARRGGAQACARRPWDTASVWT